VNVARALVFVFLVRSLMVPAVATVPAHGPLPMVSAAAILEYPPIAVQARIAGDVSFLVSTDGERIVAAEVLRSVGPLLDRPAFENLRTWRFEPHRAAQFDVTFTFSIVPARCPWERQVPSDDAAALVRTDYPTRVEIRQAPDIICEDITPSDTGAINAFYKHYGIQVILNPPPSVCCPAGSPKMSRARRMFVEHASVTGYPAAARASGVEGIVRLSVGPDGRIEIVDGPPELSAPTLAAVRTWRISPPSVTAEIRFIYSLLPGDCSGGGPIVHMAPHPAEVSISAKRVVDCAGIAQRSTSFNRAATVGLPAAFNFTRPTSIR